MGYRVLADVVVIIHLAFVAFAVLGGLLLLNWRRWAWIHLPAVLWAATVELMGWICPLTPLENWLRINGGHVGYNTGFVEHYLIPLLYPNDLTRDLQILLGLCVLMANFGIYAWILSRRISHLASRISNAVSREWTNSSTG